MKTIINGKIYINTEYTQIINGEEIDLPSPKTIHQLAMGKLLLVLCDHVDAHQPGEIYRVPFDVIFEENFNVLQPDFLFISRQNESTVQDVVCGIPDLVIEVVSPEMLNIDTVIKKGIYEHYGVPECWLVYPEKVCVEIYTLNNGKYSLQASFSGDERVQSHVLDQLSFPVNVIAQ
ncbi:MAG: Uma2 family endonuclease [Dyadobacter sp.]|uniref:Uma2 family endonuclease n=1 Tax=Dyadobacter sp. TaxID=1914288 RepID=UPI001B0B6617|nr:Uma2 family endonuclease [Dyadobacter sp.]MBO9613706.1 Uma2 family endonuclease [Dyadobacter sp.]